MRQSFIIVLCCMLLVNITRAQQDGLRIGIGLQRTWLIDHQASPLKYQTSEKTFMLGYGHTGNKGKWYAQLDGSIGKLFPTGFHDRKWYNENYGDDGSLSLDSNLMTGTIYHGNFSAGYLTQVSHGMSTVGKESLTNHHYLGGAITNQLFYTDNIVRNAWFNSTAVNLEWESNFLYSARHFLSVRLSIPIIARNTRLPYHNTVSSPDGSTGVKTVLQQGSRFAWFGSFQNIRIDAAYEYSISRSVGLGLHYSGQWLRYEYEKPIRLFQNNIGLVATIK